MTKPKGTLEKKRPNEPIVKSPFGRSRKSIDDLLGPAPDTGKEPGELGRAFLNAINVEKKATDDAPEDAVSPTPQPTMADSSPERGTVANTDAGDGVLISLDLIVENPKLQPRLRINEDHVLSLSEKFEQHGQLNSILVRPTDVDGERRYEIIGGNHRFRAAKRLGWHEIRCNVLSVSLEEARVMAVDDNDSHLPTSDYERALAYESLLEDKVFSSQSDLAERLGVSKGRVSQCLSFTALPPSVRDILNDHPDLFSYRTAMDLRKLIQAHSNEGGEAPSNVIEFVTAGVMRLVDGAPLSGLLHWIEQRIAGRASFQPTIEPRIVLDGKGRTAFKTKAKANSVVVEWDKNTSYSTEDIQEALMAVLRNLAERRDEQE